MTTRAATEALASRAITIEISGVTGAGKTSLLHILGRYLREQGFPVDLEDADPTSLSGMKVRPETLDEEIAEADLARFREYRMHHPITLRTRLTEATDTAHPEMITPAARAARGLLEDAPAELHLRGLRVELAKCSPGMRRWLLEYTSPQGGGVSNPLADLETLEERTLADATAQLARELIAARRDDEAIEDALVSLRGHLEEHFLQRKYAKLYEH